MKKSFRDCYDPDECIRLDCSECDMRTLNHSDDCECSDCWTDRNCDANGTTISDADNGL